MNTTEAKIIIRLLNIPFQDRNTNYLAKKAGVTYTHMNKVLNEMIELGWLEITSKMGGKTSYGVKKKKELFRIASEMLTKEKYELDHFWRKQKQIQKELEI